MKIVKLISSAVSVLACSVAFGQSVTVTGAGATFPYPLYAKWADEYKKAQNVAVNYQSIGSGGGIRQIKAKTVDFGASDMPLKIEELNADGLLQFPATIGGVVPVANLDAVTAGQLKLTGTVLADIFLGKVKVWNDPAITALNPGVALKADPITVVRRADGSGTTFLLTDYLSKISPEWKTKVGSGTAVSWPEGVGGKGNEGVAAYVQRIKGSIGYVEYAYAKKNKMDHAMMQNRDGVWVAPDDDTFAAAAANAKWDAGNGFNQVLTDQPGKQSWPMTGASFILMQKEPKDAARAVEVMKFFSWALKNGGKSAAELDYVPIPAPVTKQIEDYWKASVKVGGNPLWK
jgi:phosphate transport system substrate-binding protein